ncbi:MAG: hypothetical protein A3E83_05545 [Gammaproteobacteria bacterium RIFCSPHIGHO2_12_FULL_41_20]|nr:MAG: hypothetical protein A3E83_05545 [Gammaproteobacteria bacterium RIFCSPHIGHO2_12_FULL_41_20]
MHSASSATKQKIWRYFCNDILSMINFIIDEVAKLNLESEPQRLLAELAAKISAYKQSSTTQPTKTLIQTATDCADLLNKFQRAAGNALFNDGIDHESIRNYTSSINRFLGTNPEAILSQLTEPELDDFSRQLEKTLAGEVDSLDEDDPSIAEDRLESAGKYIIERKKQFHLKENTEIIVQQSAQKIIEVYQRFLQSLTAKLEPTANIWFCFQEELNSIFAPLKTRDVDTLNDIITHAYAKAFSLLAAEEKPVELCIILENTLDDDLRNVILMRARECEKKGKFFIVIDQATALILATESKASFALEKLSLLHHWSQQRKTTTFLFEDSQEPEQVQEKITSLVARLVEKTPTLQEIVLRGCGTAGEPLNYADFHPKKIRVISKHKDIEKETLDTTTLLIQQKTDGDRITTLFRYYDNRIGGYITKTENDFPLLPANKPIESFIQIYLQKNHLPAIDTTQKTPSLSQRFFQPGPMNHDERKQVKRTTLRARTEQVAEFPEHSMVDNVRKRLSAIGRENISVKGYIGGYQALDDRTAGFTDSGYTKYPRALRRGRKT